MSMKIEPQVHTALLKGSLQAAAEIYETYARRAEMMANRRLNDVALAEIVVTKVFDVFFRRVDAHAKTGEPLPKRWHDGPEQVVMWLWAVLRYAINRARKQRLAVCPVDEDRDAAPEAADVDPDGAMADAARRLSPAMRRVWAACREYAKHNADEAMRPADIARWASEIYGGSWRTWENKLSQLRTELHRLVACETLSDAHTVVT